MDAASATHLSWLLRIQEAENLLGARSAELDNRTAITRGLEQELQQQAGLKASLGAQARAEQLVLPGRAPPNLSRHPPPRRTSSWSGCWRRRPRTRS